MANHKLKPISAEKLIELQRLKAICACVFGVDPEAMESETRDLKVCHARFAYYLYAYKELNIVKSQIAGTIGKTRGAGEQGVSKAISYIDYDKVFADNYLHVEQVMKLGNQVCPTCQGNGYITKCKTS